MLDTTGIHREIGRARTRMRVQLALQRATLAVVIASAMVAVTVFLWRRDAVGDVFAMASFAAAAAVIFLAGVSAFLRVLPDAVVATRIDRASALHNRLANACAFEQRLATDTANEDAETRAFMMAAINDAVQSLPRANVQKAAPIQAPTQTRAAAAFVFAAGLLAGLYFPTTEAVVTPPRLVATEDLDDQKTETVDLEDDTLEYTQDLLVDLRETAERTGDEDLKKFADEVSALLEKAKNSELTKAEMLDKLAKAEEKYMQGSGEDAEAMMKELAKTGQELAKNRSTKELGEALKQGDLNSAKKALEKLAEKLENNQLSKQEQEKLAKALEKAAEQFEKREQQQKKADDKQLQASKKEIEKMQRRRDEEKDPEKRERLTKKIDEKKRELKKLEHKQQERQDGVQRRALKELHRDMKQSAKHMNQPSENKQQQQQQQKLAARSLKSAAEKTGNVDKDQRKRANQKKVASQMSDLKEALRRARRKGKNGQQSQFGKNSRNQDFRRRARGQSGQQGAWKPGQGKPGPGQQPGQGTPNGQGSKDWGTHTDPNIMGDPTAKSGNTKDESISGVHGKGPSTRETILTSAQKGFASASYKDVFVRYKTIVEEVMRTEKVPSGYKYYVKRYFLKIKPHAVDGPAPTE